MNRGGNIYRRRVTDWQRVDGWAKQVTVGESGVWHLNSHGNMWYRTGTYGDVDTAGSGVGDVLLLNILHRTFHILFTDITCMTVK